jgi:exodeoxyribonuclease V alpha subunit
MNYDLSQLRAIEHASNLSNKLTILTGGAGSGKTSCIKEIVNRLGDCDLLSSTGKAGARLSEVMGKPCSTVHRFLGYDGTQYRRIKWFDKPVIIDEMGMIDSALMAKILEYHPQKLILVGDDSQLEPVGIGCPFRDLIAILPQAVARLTVCHRASGSIHKASQAIREGRAPLTCDESGGEKFKLMETGEAEPTTQKLLKWIKDGFYNPRTDMIVSPRYGAGNEEYDGGIDSINKEIKKILNPSESKFAVGDRVIGTKNNSKLDFWNGDLGFITDINIEGGVEILLDRNGADKSNTIWVDKKDVINLRLAYALSVHKAQGSEAQHVFVICLNSHYFQLTRSLIYTAITRAKKAVVVMGQMKAFYSAINKDNPKKTILQWLGNKI